MYEKDAQSQDQQFEFDLARIGLVVIIPVAFWAFYTTFQGLKDVTRQGPDDIFGIVGAFIGSAAILSLMALSSWQLGTDAAAAITGRRRTRGSNVGLIILIPAFLFFLSMSTFFSYTYYHTNFFGLASKQMEGERQPRALGNVVIPLIDDVVEKEKKKRVDAVLDAQGAKDWLNGIDVLTKAAGAGGKQFESLADDAAKKNAANEQARLLDAGAARDQAAAIRTQLADQQRIVKAAGDVIDPQDKEVARLRGVEASEKQMARASELGLDKSKTAKCGEICDGHVRAAKQAHDELSRIDAALKEPRDRKQAALKKIDELNLKLPELDRRAGNNASGVAAQGGRSAPPVAAPNSPAPANIKDQLGALAAAHESFMKDPSMAVVANVGTSCRSLLGVAQNLGAIAGIPPGFDCSIRTDAAEQALDNLESFRQEEAVYDQKCALGVGLGKRLDDISAEVRIKHQPEQGLIQARNVLQECADQAVKTIGHSSGLEPAYTAMTNFESEQSLERSRFTNATSHLRKFDGDARLALSVALAQDLLILIFKFLADYYKYASRPRRTVSVGALIDLSDRKSAPAEIRARAALLRLAKPYRSNSCRIAEEDIRREQLPQEVEANLMGLINGFGRKDLLWQIGKGAFAIDNEALHQIEMSLERAAGPVASGGDSRAEDPIASASALAGAAARPEEQPARSAVSDKAQPSATERPSRRSIRDLAGAAINKRLAPKPHYEPAARSSVTVPPTNQPGASVGGDETQNAPQPAHGFDQLRKLRT